MLFWFSKQVRQMSERVLCVDPESPSAINTTDIKQKSVTVSWSVGQTQVVNRTVVHYRVSASTGSFQTSYVVDATSTSHTVTLLQPGTEYEIYVAIHSYEKSARSNTVTITTGNKQSAYRAHLAALSWRALSAALSLSVCLPACLSCSSPITL